MIFGTDYPFGAERGEDSVRTILFGIKSMDIPAGDFGKKLGGNAKKPLKINKS